MDKTNPKTSSAQGKGNGLKPGSEGSEGHQYRDDGARKEEGPAKAKGSSQIGNRKAPSGAFAGGDESGGDYRAAAKPGGSKNGNNRGAAPSPNSFKEALGFNGGSQAGNQPYLVDLAEEAVEVEIINPAVDAYFKTLSEDAIIGRFNGLWPSSSALYQW
ncbi:hypothetical protein KI387_020699, partial [Taxus chinensis]